MAAGKPDLDDGFIPFANEAAAAFLCNPMFGPRGYVLFEVFAQVYGWAKLESATLSPTEIAERTGIRRESISRAITQLCKALILIEQDDGTYKLNKYYDRFRFDENPAFKAARVSYVGAANEFVRGCKQQKARNQMVTKPRNQMVTDENPPYPNGHENRDQMVTEFGPPKNPLKVEEFNNKPTNPGVGVCGPNSEDEFKPFELPANHQQTPPDFEALCRKAEALDALKGGNFGPLLRGSWSSVQGWWEKNPDPKLWNHALLELAGCDKNLRNVRYFMGIVKRLIAEHWTEDSSPKRKSAEDNYPHPPIFTMSPEARKKRMEADARLAEKLAADPDYNARRYQRPNHLGRRA